MVVCECKRCGYKWNSSTKSPHHCPACKSTKYNEERTEPLVCSYGGGICDLCGAEFRTKLLQDNFCPNCGSKRWRYTEMDKQRRLEDVHPWKMEKIKDTKEGPKTYEYWMASWREGDKVRNVHLGSCRKISEEEALQKARAMKAAYLEKEGINTM